MKTTEYIKPNVKMIGMDEEIMAAATKLDENADNQNITPTDDEYQDEFGAKGFSTRSVWDE